MLVRLQGVLLLVAISVFCFSLIRSYWGCHRWQISHIVSVTDDLSWISKFIFTGFTTQSLYYPQILRITTAKIIAAITRSLVSFFFFPSRCVIVLFIIGRTEKNLNANTPSSLTQTASARRMS